MRISLVSPSSMPLIAPLGKVGSVLRLSVRRWCKESLEFKLVDVLAHHFKHVQSSDEKIPASRPGLPIDARARVR